MKCVCLCVALALALSACASGPTVFKRPDGTLFVHGSTDILNKAEGTEYVVEAGDVRISYKRAKVDNSPVVNAWTWAKGLEAAAPVFSDAVDKIPNP